MQHHPSIDLTAAADAYNLANVPPIVVDEDVADDMGSPAAFSRQDNAIHVNDNLYADLTDPYDEGRFARQGVGPLDQEDAQRFILAHELFHAKQYESDPDGMLADAEQTRYRELVALLTSESAEQYSQRMSDIHDTDPTEVAADEAAAKVYRLVKFDATS